MAVKINALTVENVKRVKAVQFAPDQNGLTIIGGDNNQGKTSVLDAIAWALGGNKMRPSNPAREESTIPPNIEIHLSNGLLVTRSGKNSDLHVIDPEGHKAGQQLLDEFIEALALNLPKFMNANNKEKAHIMLQIIGVEDQLAKLELDEKTNYNERLAIGRIAEQKKAAAAELPFYDDVPDEPVSASDLIQSQQEILARNAQRQQWIRDHDAIMDELLRLDHEVEDLEKRLAEAKAKRVALEDKRKESEHSPAELQMESTEELEKNLAEIEMINRKVASNIQRQQAMDEADKYAEQYDQLTLIIEGIRKQKMELLNGADLPLPELSVEDGELTYKGQKWDNMSGSEQLMVATAIVRKINPECGFVLMDKLEQMDLKTLKTFGQWLSDQGLQAIATRVSTGDECKIIIEDGYIAGMRIPMKEEPKKWEAGKF